ncbi:hypothetical protein BJ322DRAFT_240454 [Thelephora terrestris]|uniref:Uncharacterized protein n=1 Tax=Thelephora terrestris TaxID=56493 RepID=A0A9P6H8R0_9AGAM|nr:hypothetical protein BJ322DRAFT_240454 [Thelephora terrestris]
MTPVHRIFEDGKLKPGIYKIQSIYTESYLDIHLHSMEACCRSANDLAVGRGLWEIRRFGDGYAVWRVDPGNPPQFCSLRDGLGNGAPLIVTPYPVAWRIEPAVDAKYRGFEYVRFHWGSTDRTWDLLSGCKDNGAPVAFYDLGTWAWQYWRLIPTEVEGNATLPQPSHESLGLDPLPPYNENEHRRSSTHAQESERDDFGTVVTEVTTSIITTRKKYRVEPGDAYA